VLSTLPIPTIASATPFTAPVKVGLASGALLSRAPCVALAISLLESVFVLFKGVSDELYISEAPNSFIESSLSIVGENIISKCFSLLERKNFTQKFHVVIKKNIPMGAGL
jgi:mevalonate kinase